MKTVGMTTRAEYVIGHMENILKSDSKKVKLSLLPDGMWYIETEKEMNEIDKAFMESFQDRFSQHNVSDDDIEEFLIGNSSESIEGYTALADASGLWSDALEFAKTLAIAKPVV
jgi:hypothetical protein